MIIAKKISVGGINGVRKGFKGISAITFVARIVGICQSYKVGTHAQYGDYYEFTGEFQATNMDGEIFVAPKCFLPEPVDGLLKAAIDANNGSVNFGFDIHAVPNETSTTGYEYRVTNLFDAKPSNPLAELMAKVEPLKLEAKTKQPELPGVAAKDSVSTNDGEKEQAKTEAEAKPNGNGKKAK